VCAEGWEKFVSGSIGESGDGTRGEANIDSKLGIGSVGRVVDVCRAGDLDKKERLEGGGTGKFKLSKKGVGRIGEDQEESM
jgi:hypothetical protein